MAEFGELHPRILKALDAEGPMLAFELNLDAIPEGKRKGLKTKAALDLSPLMPLRRDFAFLVDAATPAGDLVRPIAGVDKALIADVRIFDVYQGKGVETGFKSVAMGLILQEQTRTLTDRDVDAVVGGVIASLQRDHGATIRS